MIHSTYQKEEIQEIRIKFHSKLEFLKQFTSIEIDEEKAIENFLQGNFKVGSIEDPLLDCLGEATSNYKFKITPIRINNMNSINNLPHIMDAEIVKPASNFNTVKGSVAIINYSAKPSSKKPGKAIVSATIAYGEEEINFKYSTKIENASDEVLESYFGKLSNVLDSTLQFNVSFEETENSSKGVFNAKFEANEVDTYGQYFDIEPVEAEINFTQIETVISFLKSVFENTQNYHEMLENIEEGSRVITINKGGKNIVEYISNESPEILGNLIKLTGNISSEETLVSALDVKSVSEHILTEEDVEAMGSVIFSDLEVREDIDEEEDESETQEEAETTIESEAVVPEDTEPEGL